MLCQKPHLEKNRFDWKSQGQIFQECQGQIPRSNISGMPRSNAKVKFPKVKWETTKNWKKPVLTGKIGKMGKWESVTKKKKPKTLKEMSIL